MIQCNHKTSSKDFQSISWTDFKQEEKWSSFWKKEGKKVNACTVLACKKTQLDTSQTLCHP
jgi:hypothetical protein